MKKVTFLLLTFSIFVLGCSSENDNVLIIHEEVVGDLAYKIQLDKNQFAQNEEIKVYAKVKNIGNKTLTYISGSSSCPQHLDIQIKNQKLENYYLAIKPNNRECTADEARSRIAPGKTVEQELIFISKYFGTSGLIPAEPGTYHVEVSLPPEDFVYGEDNRLQPLQPRPNAKTTIRLVN